MEIFFLKLRYTFVHTPSINLLDNRPEPGQAVGFAPAQTPSVVRLAAHRFWNSQPA
jgi:hypothetical protein